MKYSVKKTRMMQGQMETLKKLTFDLNHWKAWSPWLYIDPQATNRTEGETGVGQSMHWDGKVIGSGSVTTKQMSESRIEFDLIFLKPFKSKATTFIELASEGEQVEVSWCMEGNVPFFLFFLKNLFKTLIGKDYDRGLKRLDYLVNQGEVPATIEVTEAIQPIANFKVYEIRGKCHETELAEKMGAKFQELQQAISSDKQASKFLSLVYKVNLTKGLFHFGAAVEQDKNLALNTTLKSNKFRVHRALKVTLKGDYFFLEDTWTCGMMHLRSKKLKRNKSIPSYERYLVGPHNEENANNFVTEIFIPIK